MQPTFPTNHHVKTTLKRLYNFAGNLGYLVRQGGQKQLYDSIKQWKVNHPEKYGPYVALCHRRLGKSTCSALLGVERCLAEPNMNVTFLAPLQNQCDRIVRPILRKVMKDIPPEIKVKWRLNQISFNNPRWKDKKALSTFQYLGADKDDGNHLRGCPSQNLVIIDEAGMCANLTTLVEDVLIYVFQGMKDPLLLMISTPPASLDHDLVTKYIPLAQREGNYLVIGASQNCMFSEADEKAILDATGGTKESIHWQREAECQLVQDPTLSTVPEYAKARPVIEVEEHERPPFFFPILCADMGWEDHTALLGGYIDFQKQLLIIEGEVLMRRATTREFADAVVAMEARLFHGIPEPVRRFADGTPQQLDDLWREHRLQFIEVERYDRLGALARLRTLIKEHRVRLCEGTRQLRYQLLTGLVTKEGKLCRTESLGHQDATAALIYMARMAPWLTNPFPIPQVPSDRFSPPGYVPECPPPAPTDANRAGPGRLNIGGAGQITVIDREGYRRRVV